VELEESCVYCEVVLDRVTHKMEINGICTTHSYTKKLC